jgi:hypothetical protein
MPFEPATYRLEMADYLRINRAIYVRQMRWILPLAIAAMAFGSRDALFSGDGRSLWLIPIFGVLIAIGLLIQPYVFLPRKARTLFREHHAVSEEATLKLSKDGFEIEQASGLHRYKWDHLVRWTETPDMVVVYPSRGLLLWFTKEAVGAERLAYMRERMIASGLATSGQLRKRPK